MDALRGMMHGCDYSLYETQALQILPRVMNHILSLEGANKELDGKKRFLDVMAKIRTAFTLCGTMDEAEEFSKEIAFFGAVKNAISKFTTIDKRRTDEEKNLAVDLLEKLLRDEIKARMKTDVVSGKKYSERIMETLRKYHNCAIETAQVIEELIKMAKDMAEDAELAEKSGLNPNEIAFYRALIKNESAVKELGDDKLRSLAIFVTEQLRKSTTVDWQVRDSVRAKLRNLVRRALRKWKYPPDRADEAIELCLQQAEALSQSWSDL
jgi:type I restriction enzyme R subunit